jgi:PhnB protein
MSALLPINVKGQVMAQAIAYLGFNGDCAEAIRFYARVLGLGATVQQLVSGADTPMRDQIPPEHRPRIIHARLRFDDGSYLFAGDAPAQLPYEGIKSVSIAMNYPTVAEAERVFRALADGGKVTMSQQPTMWARSCGMVTDRFGTPWIINGELQGEYAL